jgi:ATP-dependent Clp protease ATP-binding subunit ClpA
MFERYTEKARRTVFFARYEAAQVGSAYIETEHILLGLLREDGPLLHRLLPNLSASVVREQLTSRLPHGARVSTSVDLPLSKESRNILAHAAEEADRLSDSYIGTEHLLLALLREPETYTAQMLHQNGARLAELRLAITKSPDRPIVSRPHYRVQQRASAALKDTVEIHGTLRSVENIRHSVKRLREESWHWQKRPWTARDIAVDRRSKAMSFDLSLVNDSASFEVIKKGWSRECCAICRWELFESPDDATHGVGYTNGHDWLCTECYDKFLTSPDFFSSSHPEST